METKTKTQEEFPNPLALGTKEKTHIILAIIGKTLLMVLGMELRQLDFSAGSKIITSKKTRMGALTL